MDRVSNARQTMGEIVRQAHAVGGLIDEITQGSRDQLQVAAEINASVSLLDQALRQYLVPKQWYVFDDAFTQTWPAPPPGAWVAGAALLTAFFVSVGSALAAD